MRGTWKTTGDGASAAGAAAALVLAGLLTWALEVLLAVLWAVLAAGLAFTAGAAVGLVLVARHYARPAPRAVLHGPAVLPGGYGEALPPRPAQALPGPQHVHYHLHLNVPDEQAITERRTP